MTRRLTAFVLALLLAAATHGALADHVPGTGSCGKEYCYWETPMDITDPETVWNVLIQPMTVIKGKQRVQVQLRAEPRKDAEKVGEVTCRSQGVHVLETLDNGWSLIECYSSSNNLSRLDVFSDLVRGYVPTDMLEVRETKTKYGLVVDKLAQRMYVFQEGELLSTLRVSTGKPTRSEPQRDTNAGEFHLVSMVGTFVSENGAICEYGIRFNDGDLLHGVPYLLKENGDKNFATFDRELGQKASAGCIRVQRRRSPEGVNMLWLWNKLYDQQQTKLLIWEDLPGRQLPIPSDDTPVYILPGLSNSYHSKPTCYDLDKMYFPMEGITYGQLEDEAYAELNNCPYCNPPLRVHELEEINRQYAVEETAE